MELTRAVLVLEAHCTVTAWTCDVLRWYSGEEKSSGSEMSRNRQDEPCRAQEMEPTRNELRQLRSEVNKSSIGGEWRGIA